MINSSPMYLVGTSNQNVANAYQAKRCTSLMTNETILSGFMMNIHEDGLVTTTNGMALFKMSHITKIEESEKSICITTKNSTYFFAVA